MLGDLEGRQFLLRQRGNQPLTGKGAKGARFDFTVFFLISKMYGFETDASTP